MKICVIKMEIIICIGLYDEHTMSQPRNMNYGITCLSNGWNYFKYLLECCADMNELNDRKDVVHAYVMY